MEKLAHSQKNNKEEKSPFEVRKLNKDILRFNKITGETHKLTHTWDGPFWKLVRETLR